MSPCQKHDKGGLKKINCSKTNAAKNSLLRSVQQRLHWFDEETGLFLYLKESRSK